jgi:hypothetical protein
MAVGGRSGSDAAQRVALAPRLRRTTANKPNKQANK